MYRKVMSAILCAVLLLCAFSVSALGDAEEVNLVLGRSYTFETGEPITLSYALFSDGDGVFEADRGQLTDSNVGLTDSESGVWYRAYRGGSRTVSFDLEGKKGISRVEAGFLQSADLGIYAPRYIKVFLSDDGKNYGLVAEHKVELTARKDSAYHVDVKVDLGNTYSASFVKVQFGCDEFVYCDEIAVFGYETLLGTEMPVISNKEENKNKEYLKSISGVSNIVVFKNGYSSEREAVVSLSKEELLPYVAYLDINGEIAGRMFDCGIFAPCGKDFGTKSHWDLYFDNTFALGQDLDALDEVVASVYKKLNYKGKFKVFLTIPYLKMAENNFGDINGDGVSENCASMSDRLNIVKWYVKKCVSAFEENGYTNLELSGFCWGNGYVDYNKEDSPLISQTNAFLKQEGFISLSNFDYLASGFDFWKNLGFSHAVMGSDFSKNRDYFKSGMLEEFAKSVKNNGMGVVIQAPKESDFDGNRFRSFGREYESQLYYGYKTDYMKALTVFDVGIDSGVLCKFCNSDMGTPKGRYLRRLYDLTYNFLHGTYENLAPTLSAENFFELVQGDEKVTIPIKLSDNDSYLNDLELEIVREPSRGRVVAASGNKSLLYNVDDREFSGEDSFVLRAFDGFNYSEELEITVSVKGVGSSETESSEPTFESSVENSKAPVQNSPLVEEKEESPVWAVGALGCLAFLMVLFMFVQVIGYLKNRK